MLEHLQTLNQRKRKLLESLAVAKKARNEADGKMQSRYDTQKEEWALQCEILESQIHDIDKLIKQLKSMEAPRFPGTISVGHYVDIEFEDGECETFLLTDGQGGVDLGEVQTLSTDSPIGKSILGTQQGQEITVDLGETQISARVVSVN
jgi:transcription elongation GreA/GreB family factor